MTSKTLEGGCGCGAVRYRLTDAPFIVHNCHCGLCQRQTGTGSAVNAFIETDRLGHLSGELREVEFATGSGVTQIVIRCAKCGTPLWSHYPRLGRKTAAVRVGTFDTRRRHRPTLRSLSPTSPHGRRCPRTFRRSTNSTIRPTSIRRKEWLG